MQKLKNEARPKFTGSYKSIVIVRNKVQNKLSQQEMLPAFKYFCGLVQNNFQIFKMSLRFYKKLSKVSDGNYQENRGKTLSSRQLVNLC